MNLKPETNKLNCGGYEKQLLVYRFMNIMCGYVFVLFVPSMVGIKEM